MGVAQVDNVPQATSAPTAQTVNGNALHTHADQHPLLKRVSIVNCGTSTEIVPNSVPMPIESDLFTGHIMLLIRTPDVDDPKEIKPRGEVPRRVSSYLKNYKRRFEFQFQLKFKKLPTGPMFLGCEVNDPVKLSRFTKGLSGMLLAMIRRINSGFHYSWGLDMKKATPADQAAIREGRYERTHLSFPVEASMDRIMITKPGEKPPDLGHELFETPESVKRRRRLGAGSVDWNLEDTYTMCLWSAYCDWIKWKSMNVPGVRPFSLSSVTGKQPIYLCVYEISGITPQEYKKKKPAHYKKDLRVYTRLEFTHSEMTEGGISPRFSKGAREDSSLVETDSEIGSESDIGDSQKRAFRR